MKFSIALLLTALLTFAVGLFSNVFPWWSFVICALIVAAAIYQKPWKAFTAAFLGVFILWIILAALLDFPNEHLLSGKVAEILHVGSYSVVLIVTGIIGGLVAGMGGLTGSYLRKK